VIVTVDPGSVVTIVCPGSVTVERSKLVTVEGGSCVVNVVVTGGSVNVERIVDAGNCVVTVSVSPGRVTTTGGSVNVDTIVLAG
jgi:hypothetical protein